MKHKTLSILLAALMNMVAGVASAYDAEIDGIYYNFSGTSAIVKNGETKYTGRVVIPESVVFNGDVYYVTEIGPGAFSGCTDLTFISFPNSVTKIGADAFKDCKGLTYIKFPDNLTDIGAYAFRYCTGLTYLVLPPYIESIGGYAFDMCTNIRNVIYRGNYVNIGGMGTTPTIFKVEDFITWTDNQYTYTGNAPQPLNYTNNLRAGFVPTKVGTPVMETGAGEHTVTVPFTFANSDMEFDVDIPFTYSIAKAPITARVKNVTREYGVANPVFESEYVGFVNGEDASVITSNGSYTTTATAKSDVGTYEVTQAGATADNYEVTGYEPGTLTITKAALTLTAKDKSMTYGESLPALEISYNGLKNNETAPKWNSEPTISTTATSQSPVGTYPITISGGDAVNYELTRIAGNLSIEQASLILTAENKSRLYGDDNPEFTLRYTGLKNNETVPEWVVAPVLTTPANKMSDAGSYPINISDAAAVNYKLTSAVNGTLTVTKAALEVKPQGATRQYGEENPAFTLQYTGLKNDETAPAWTSEPQITTTATKSSPVGTYTIKIASAVAKNYTLTTGNGILTVTKAPVTIRVKDCTKTYGQDNPTFELEYTGLCNNETKAAWTEAPHFETDAIKNSSVGSYTIEASGGTMTNYETERIIPGTLTIVPASLTLKANDLSKLYFEDTPEMTFRCEGLVAGDDASVALLTQPTLSTDATKTSAAGIYPIGISGASSRNYDLTYKAGTLTINKRTLVVMAKSYTRTYGEENPAFELTYSGFVNNEDENVLLIKPSGTTAATPTSNVGDYAITITGGEANNYDFSYVAGTLTIEKAYQTLAWEQELTELKRFDEVELTASATSGLGITYVIADPTIAEITKIGNKQFLTCLKGGETTIYAIQEGNENYWMTNKMYKLLRVTDETPVSNIFAEDAGAAIYDVNGTKRSYLKKGVNIIRTNDGTIKKILVK